MRRRRVVAASARGPDQRAIERCVRTGTSASAPSSVTFCTTRSGLAPFVSANATTRRGRSAGSATAGPAAVMVRPARLASTTA
jgi:hypothetical protein